jgi:hypothetical protein
LFKKIRKFLAHYGQLSACDKRIEWLINISFYFLFIISTMLFYIILIVIFLRISTTFYYSIFSPGRSTSKQGCIYGHSRDIINDTLYRRLKGVMGQKIIRRHVR